MSFGGPAPAGGGRRAGEPATTEPTTDTSAAPAGVPSAEPTVGEVGEDGILAVLLPTLPTGRRTIIGPGDDCAVVASSDSRLVVSADMLVEGHHFRGDWGTPADVGWRAAMQNLADVAAMGAEPIALVVSLGLPPRTPVGWVRELGLGFAEACDPIGVGVVGGDLTAAESLTISVAVHGDLVGRDPVLRSGARPGDVVALAGRLGPAAAGLALLMAGSPHVVPGADDLVAACLRPHPPIASGQAAADAGAHAMLDVSDGLVRDAGRIARASGVGMEIDSAAALAMDGHRLAPAARALGIDPLEWVLHGGEDHGLLATFAPDADLPPGFVPIGTVVAESGVRVDGEAERGLGGWDHFA